MLFLFFFVFERGKAEEKANHLLFRALSLFDGAVRCVCVCVRLFSTNGHFWLTVCFKSILTRTMLLFFF